jgi:hypothetical protein
VKNLVRNCVIFMLFFAISGCGTAPVVKPEWTRQTGHANFNGSVYVVGRSDGKQTEKEAMDSAFIAALGDLNLYFGVSVNATLEDVESETDGVYSYSLKKNSVITGSPIKINKFNKTNVFTEKVDGKFNGYVQIAVPVDEAGRIAKEIKGMTGYKVIPAKAGHEDILSDFVRQWSQKKGLKIAGSALPVDDNVSIDEIAKKSDTAYFIVVKGEVEEPKQDGKVFITKVKVIIRQFSLVEGRELNTIVEEMKWGEYTPEEAVDKGMKKLVQKMLAQ